MPENYVKPERITQNKVIKFFQEKLDYKYLGNWEDRTDTRCVDESVLLSWLTGVGGYSEDLAKRAVKMLTDATKGTDLYVANKEVYQLLKYGAKVHAQANENYTTVYFIDWKSVGKNWFGVAEEVTVIQQANKRPDVVVYVNGIALAVLELKKSVVSVSEGIRQNLLNQHDYFISEFFSSAQLVLAGNESQGLFYGTIETPERYYTQWKDDGFKEHTDEQFDYDIRIDEAAKTQRGTLFVGLYQMFSKVRFLRFIEYFVVFDRGAKKLARYNQYYACQRALKRLAKNQGGIIWHTQGSGKSLSMLWLAEMLLEEYSDGRFLIVTDREELDEQIQKNYEKAGLPIVRTTSGKNLLNVLNDVKERRVCSLIHKFGHHNGGVSDKDWEKFVEELKNSLPADFSAKGRIFVFVDECHRTQSGVLHSAMKVIVPQAIFIGFTGTPLLKSEHRSLTSMEKFGPFIHTYKYNEGVKDGVILDLKYDPRYVDLDLRGQQTIDEWFEAHTSGLTDKGKAMLKRQWANMQTLYSSRERLERIAFDINSDFQVIPRLKNGGNAILIADSIYSACRYFEIFQRYTQLKDKCAIISSYIPSHRSVTQDFQGARDEREAFEKFNTYLDMVGWREKGENLEGLEQRVAEFEEEAKKTFIDEPYRMRLLIVVDKLLTGFDAPHCTYLYIDKKMRDHGLFQAICRTNRLDGDEKSFGHIVDYKNLFNNISEAMIQFTDGAFDGFDREDIEGMLHNKVETTKKNFLDILTSLDALCSGLSLHADGEEIRRYFCGTGNETPEQMTELSRKRNALYSLVRALVNSFADFKLCYYQMSYTDEQKEEFQHRVEMYTNMSMDIGLASGDYVDVRRYAGEMRDLIDQFVSADIARRLSELEQFTLMDYIDSNKDSFEQKKMSEKQAQHAAEVIENNLRREISERLVVNPKYFAQMSVLLKELIDTKKKEIKDYVTLLTEYKKLVEKVEHPENDEHYPASIRNSMSLRAWYDFTDGDEELSLQIDNAIRNNKQDDFQNSLIKCRKLKGAICRVVQDENKTEQIYKILCAQEDMK